MCEASVSSPRCHRKKKDNVTLPLTCCKGGEWTSVTAVEGSQHRSMRHRNSLLPQEASAPLILNRIHTMKDR